MGHISPPPAVKLFAGILTSLPEIIPEVEERLAARFGPVDLRSQSYPFDQTTYYDEEMGNPIVRCFLAFQTLIAPEEISSVKRATNDMEASFAAGRCQVRRPVNLDPGYMEESKIVLVSTKNFYHRILLSEGIYGEVTLHFRGGAWQAFPWTFPDFRSGRYDGFFTQLRRCYRDQRKSATGAGGSRHWHLGA